MAKHKTAGRAKPRIGIVGFGRMVEIYHLDRLRKAGWQVEAVLDVTESRRELAARRGVPNVCARMSDFLTCRLDAVLVSTHSSVRRKVTRPLTDAGLHLMVEKPLAMTAREAQAICEDCEQAGVLLSVHHNRRWDPDMMLVQRVVNSGFIGEVFHIDNRFFSAGSAYKFGAEDFDQLWRITAAKGGGVLLDFGPHYVDQVLTLVPDAGPVVSVAADVRNIRYGDADDHFMVHLVFDNGARASIGKSDVCPVGPTHKWLVIGDRGSLTADETSVTAENTKGKRRQIDKAPRPANLLRNFREAVEGNANLLVTGRQSLRTVQIFDAARKAARTRRSLNVSI